LRVGGRWRWSSSSQELGEAEDLLPVFGCEVFGGPEESDGCWVFFGLVTEESIDAGAEQFSESLELGAADSSSTGFDCADCWTWDAEDVGDLSLAELEVFSFGSDAVR
jgi:hypothetical protein